MRFELQSKQQFHRANITKYQRILTTYLTAAERSFVERRLEEEKAALRTLDWSVIPESIDVA